MIDIILEAAFVVFIPFLPSWSKLWQQGLFFERRAVESVAMGLKVPSIDLWILRIYVRFYDVSNCTWLVIDVVRVQSYGLTTECIQYLL